MTPRRLFLALAFLSSLAFATPAAACGDGKDGKDCPCHQKKATGAKAKKDAPATKKDAATPGPAKTADAEPCKCEKGGKHCTCAKGQCHCANCGDRRAAA